ncbi:LEC14B protein-like [Chenopodium quinoa]|uniref:LEC14B homolog n=1 Tax=Chenopodium quinoa TaxID=63459 RepID=A0A803MWV2_CHEQI|nr:LEC14B protein-like [Chenopodium quinoa]XP_021743920.1 LEC14B protein-like [Chenopodium quinoa]
MYFSLVESLEENLSEENLSEMGQYVSRLELDSEDEFYDASNTANSSSYGHAHDDNSKCLDNEISDLTMIKSKPNEHLRKVVPGKRKRSVSAVKMLAGREANYSGRGRFTSADCCHVASRYVPVKGPWLLDQMSSRAYVSQFSTDGSLFITGFQGSHIRIYNVDRGWKVKKNIVAKSLRWTITDTSLSPDQQYLVYSSMSPLVHIVDIGSAAIESHANVNELHDGLDFSEYGEGYGFGIFSVKFSTDGRELVAGSSDDAIYVYDLEAKKLSLRISAHISDVNTVCFADENGHLIFSGSDDNYCKVWDRRCFIARGKAAGVMMGHLEGITFIDSRGDGRYFISNGKDQCIKIWDVRKMSSNITCDPAPRNYEWDYRWMDYPQQARHLRHPNDLSVATYEGHSVLRTLIRCYFSPEFSGKKYIYTGSNDGSVYIYDLVSGAIVAKLDHHMSVVRDCNWHPSYPMLVSSSWDGSLVKWDFSGSDEMPAPPSDERDLWRRHL